MKGDTCSNSCDSFPNVNCYYPNMFGATPQDYTAICSVANNSMAENEACFGQADRDACFKLSGCAWIATDTDELNVNGFCTLYLAGDAAGSGVRFLFDSRGLLALVATTLLAALLG